MHEHQLRQHLSDFVISNARSISKHNQCKTVKVQYSAGLISLLKSKTEEEQ